MTTTPGISYQLYCSRKFGPIEATLSMLAEIGYTAVEGYGGLYGDPGALRAALDQTGLTMPTAHFGLDMVEDTPDRAIEVARALGVEAVIVPHIMPDLRPTDADGWSAFGARLAEAGKPIEAAGFSYGWHNHDFELVDLGGTTPLEAMCAAAPGLKLELDLGWVARAGHDPVTWIDRFADRLLAVHVKDIAPEGVAVDEDGWADLGEGVLEWEPIVTRLRAACVARYVVEHDNPSDDRRFAARSLAAARGWS